MLNVSLFTRLSRFPTSVPAQPFTSLLNFLYFFVIIDIRSCFLDVGVR